MGGRNGALDTCKKEFEYAERTKGADKLMAVGTDPSVKNPRDWRGGVGMVLGSRPFKDLSMDESDPGWDANLQSLLEELVELKGGVLPSFAHRPTPPPPLPSLPERRDSGGQSGGTSAAPPSVPSSSAVPLEMTMAQKVALVEEGLNALRAVLSHCTFALHSLHSLCALHASTHCTHCTFYSSFEVLHLVHVLHLTVRFTYCYYTYCSTCRTSCT